MADGMRLAPTARITPWPRGPAPQSVALPVKFSRERIGRARLCRAAQPFHGESPSIAILRVMRGLSRSGLLRLEFWNLAWDLDLGLWDF